VTRGGNAGQPTPVYTFGTGGQGTPVPIGLGGVGGVQPMGVGIPFVGRR
jgi:hypothetical protein